MYICVCACAFVRFCLLLLFVHLIEKDALMSNMGIRALYTTAHFERMRMPVIKKIAIAVKAELISSATQFQKQDAYENV